MFTAQDLTVKTVFSLCLAYERPSQQANSLFNTNLKRSLVILSELCELNCLSLLLLDF